MLQSYHPPHLSTAAAAAAAVQLLLLQASVEAAKASLAATERQLSEAGAKLADSVNEVATLQAAVQVSRGGGQGRVGCSCSSKSCRASGCLRCCTVYMCCYIILSN